MTVTNLSDVADRVEREVRDAMRMPTLDAVRAILNEAGIRRARTALAEAPDRLAAAQNAYREAQSREALASETYQQALVEAEWELDGRFHTEGNRTYLRLPCELCGGRGASVISPDGDAEKCEACDGLGSTRKQMTADERRAYKASEAAKQPAVVDAAANLRQSETDTAAARDAVSVAEKRLSAAKYEVQAAIAELSALSAGLTAKEHTR